VEADREDEANGWKFHLQMSLDDENQDATLSVMSQKDDEGVNSVFKLNLFRGTPEVTNNYLGARLALTVQQLADCRARVADLSHELTETEETKEQVTENLEELR
jgi:hypothetical protein